MLRNTHDTYGLVAQCLHWVTAILILVLIPLGWYMHSLPFNTAQEADIKSWFYALHKTLGVYTLMLALVRIAWALFQPRPRPLKSHSTLETLAAHTIHWTLYGSILAMPITGWLQHSAAEGFSPIWWPFWQDLPLVPKDPALVELFGTAHYFCSLLLIASIALHFAGAAKHVVVDRDKTLARMVPGAYKAGAESLTRDDGHERLSPVLSIALFAMVAAATVFSFSQMGADRQTTALNSVEADASDNSWTVDHSVSKLEIEVVQANQPVMGGFERWNAAIKFDPDDLPSSSVEVEVEIGSLSLGNVTSQALSEGILNAPAFPVARFVSNAFIREQEETYRIEGMLTLAGQTRPAQLEIDLKIEGDRAFVEGKANVKRLAFGVGAAGFPDEKTIGDAVQIRFTLEAVKN